MDDHDKEAYLKKYHEEKEKGVPFFPNILFKDAIVSLLVFLVLIALAYFIGVPLEERADPADSTYTPKPEWYFLFLFQLLKYFPGELEVVGVVVLPTLAVLLLFLLPFLDRGPKRYFARRPTIIGITAFLAVSVILLTIQAVREAPPPAEAAEGDQIALLYTENCAGCHGSRIAVPSGANLHGIIAQGNHEGMPGWSADLTSDEIDALAGFILSPAGSALFNSNCGACHEAAELVASDPIELKKALDEGQKYEGHTEVTIPDWGEVLGRESRTALINFLVAPDGQRLFAVNCSPCHGRSIPFTGEEEELRSLISEGGLHLEMPSWQEKLTPSEMDVLARYVVSPNSAPEAEELYDTNCVNCHFERIPSSENIEIARETIATGGSHETMPVWGNVLTPEQLDALVFYTLDAARGTPLEVGQELFSLNCASCHGDFGEGGENPTRPDDIIAPISTAEYLKTRDNLTIQSIIAQGQPNFGMSPFGSAFGGPLDDDEIDSIVAYIRSWEADPPVELPPEVTVEGDLTLLGEEIYDALCFQCHGPGLDNPIGPPLGDQDFQASNTDQDIFDTINLGHQASSMIAWGEILTADQITQLVEFVRELPPEEAGAAGGVSFANDVMPILESRCASCHGTDGGWDSTTYDLVMTSGDHGPVIIPGDVDNSLLANKLLGTQEEGDPMPPLVGLSNRKIQVILDWIAAGAPDN